MLKIQVTCKWKPYKLSQIAVMSNRSILKGSNLMCFYCRSEYGRTNQCMFGRKRQYLYYYTGTCTTDKKTGIYLLNNVGHSVDAVISAVLSELVNISLFKEEQIMRLFSTPDWLWQEFSITWVSVLFWKLMTFPALHFKDKYCTLDSTTFL